MARPQHERDEECDVDPETDACRICGVDHGGECPACGGRGFHRRGCPDSDATASEEILSPEEAAQNIIDAGGL